MGNASESARERATEWTGNIRERTLNECEDMEGTQ